MKTVLASWERERWRFYSSKQRRKTESMKLLADVGIVKIKGEMVCFPSEQEDPLQQDV